VAGFAVLVEQIGQPTGNNLVARLGEGCEHAARPEDSTGFVVGRVKDDLFDAVAEIVVAPQGGQVLVPVGLLNRSVKTAVRTFRHGSHEAVDFAPAGAHMAVEQAADETIAGIPVARGGFLPPLEIAASVGGAVALMHVAPSQ
jgi:hypothetical protein